MDDGTRTRDNRNHNPGLYQLSYVHHLFFGQDGVPDRTRTCYPQLRRLVLYPVELRARGSAIIGCFESDRDGASKMP